jgi:hypothetical protein
MIAFNVPSGTRLVGTAERQTPYPAMSCGLQFLLLVVFLFVEEWRPKRWMGIVNSIRDVDSAAEEQFDHPGPVGAAKAVRSYTRTHKDPLGRVLDELALIRQTLNETIEDFERMLEEQTRHTRRTVGRNSANVHSPPSES